jgi:hypothetical protein
MTALGTPMCAEQIEHEAYELLRCFAKKVWIGKGATPVEMIFEDVLQEHFGIRTGYTDLNWFCGPFTHAYTDAKKRISMVDKSLSDATDWYSYRELRSTLGHAIGHCILHIPMGYWEKCIQKAGARMSWPEVCESDDSEWQAWRFCGAICMPRHLVWEMVRKVGTDRHGISAMSDSFAVNEWFVKERLRSLKICPPRSWRLGWAGG